MKLTTPDSVSRVAIIGCGTIGASWAAHFLGRGMQVTAWDPHPEGDDRLNAFVDNAWEGIKRLDLEGLADRNKLTWCDSPEAAIDGAQFIQESAPERIEVKHELYARFDKALGPDTVMSTSTSGLLLSDLQDGHAGAERYVLGHPFNPPHLIPLVEVLGGKDTAPEVVDWTLDFYNAHGKKAIRLNHEVPGHLANRMQAAIWREAIDAVDSGLASVEDVDAAIAYGPGLRWALMGPHQIFSLAGGEGGMRNFIHHFGPPNEAWWKTLNSDVKLSESVAEKIISGVDDEQAGRSVKEIAQDRDVLLLDVLETLARTRKGLKES